MLESAGMNCWIILLLFGCGCAPCSGQDPNAAARQEQINSNKARFQIPRLDHVLKLAEPNEIRMDLHGYKAISAISTWGYYDVDGHLIYPPNNNTQEAVQYDADGSSYVTFIPTKLGTLSLTVAIRFEDGRVVNDVVNVQVGLPDRKPDRLIVSQTSIPDKDADTLYLDLSTKEWLHPEAFYHDVSQPMIIDAKYVKFNMTTLDNDPPITLDKSTGLITALHSGHALIETKYEGLSDRTCVIVSSTARQVDDHSRCKELYPPGESPPLKTFQPPKSIKMISPN
jgi:hypothetical protein